GGPQVAEIDRHSFQRGPVRLATTDADALRFGNDRVLVIRLGQVQRVVPLREKPFDADLQAQPLAALGLLAEELADFMGGKGCEFDAHGLACNSAAAVPVMCVWHCSGAPSGVLSDSYTSRLFGPSTLIT